MRFKTLGSLSMADMEKTNGQYAQTASISRSMIADNFVFAISDVGIRVANWSAPAKTLSTVLYNPSLSH